LLEGGDWQAPPGLESHPFLQGYVVFLQNDPVGRPTLDGAQKKSRTGRL
jgi:hypothetical protein